MICLQEAAFPISLRGRRPRGRVIKGSSLFRGQGKWFSTTYLHINVYLYIHVYTYIYVNVYVHV